MPHELLLNNSFWQFSNEVYRADGVASECLALQRSRAVDVNLLLFACWAGAVKRTLLGAAEVDRITVETAHWNANVVRGLRQVRDWLKTSDEMKLADAAALRKRILADELSAEQIEQALLFRWFENANLAPSTQAPRDLVVANISRISDAAPPLLVAASLGEIR